MKKNQLGKLLRNLLKVPKAELIHYTDYRSDIIKSKKLRLYTVYRQSDIKEYIHGLVLIKNSIEEFHSISINVKTQVIDKIDAEMTLRKGPSYFILSCTTWKDSVFHQKTFAPRTGKSILVDPSAIAKSVENKFKGQLLLVSNVHYDDSLFRMIFTDFLKNVVAINKALYKHQEDEYEHQLYEDIMSGASLISVFKKEKKYELEGETRCVLLYEFKDIKHIKVDLNGKKYVFLHLSRKQILQL